MCTSKHMCTVAYIYIFRCLPALLDHTVNPSGFGLELFDVIGRFGHFMTALGPSDSEGTHYSCCQNSSAFIRLCLLDMD